MNAVIFYSNTGESEKIARQAAGKTGFPLLYADDASSGVFERAVIVFPVHCQNIPRAVKTFLQNAKIKKAAVIAVYGGICHGNVLKEIEKRYDLDIVAAAYLPVEHAYIDGKAFSDIKLPDAFFKKIQTDDAVFIPRSFKSPFASFFPKTRSRLGISIKRNEKCVRCGVCGAVCPEGAISYGKPNNKCIRCLKCVKGCPHDALRFKPRFFMRIYLKKSKKTVPEVYI